MSDVGDARVMRVREVGEVGVEEEGVDEIDGNRDNTEHQVVQTSYYTENRTEHNTLQDSTSRPTTPQHDRILYRLVLSNLFSCCIHGYRTRETTHKERRGSAGLSH